MKRRGLFLTGFAAILVVLAISVTCMAQTKAPQQPQPQPQQKDERWKIYLESDAKNFYFDPASVQRLENRIVRVWERITDKSKTGEETDRVKSQIEFNCSSSKYRIVASQEYDPATKTEKPEVRTENEPWTYFSLDTILGILYDNVCYQSGNKVQNVQKPKAEEKPKK